jgi:hypothetical protein
MIANFPVKSSDMQATRPALSIKFENGNFERGEHQGIKLVGTFMFINRKV